MKNFFRFSAILLALTITLFSCEQETDLTSPSTETQSPLLLPSGKIATVADAGYLVFDSPEAFLEEVAFVSKTQDLQEWKANFNSMLATGDKVIEQAQQSADEVTFIASLDERRKALYTRSGEMVRPAQTFIGYNALLNEDGLVQVGEKLHLITDKVQLIATPDMKAELVEKYINAPTSEVKDIEVIVQNNESLLINDESKLNSKPMNCPSGGVAHRQYVSGEQVVGEVFSQGNSFPTGVNRVYKLIWYVNGYNYTVNRRGRRARRVNRDIEIINEDLAVEGGLFQNGVAQTGFQFSAVDNGTTQGNNVHSIQRVVAEQEFTTNGGLDIRTNYVGGESYIVRQGNGNIFNRLGVLIFCD